MEADENLEDYIKRYPIISLDLARQLYGTGASAEQWHASNKTAKRHIDLLLKDYTLEDSDRYNDVSHVGAEEGYFVMVIGQSGAGKSATANTLIGENLFLERNSEGSSTSQVTAKVDNSNGYDLVVVDTPGSWNPQGWNTADNVDCYVMVVSLKSPRFTKETLTQMKSLKGADGTMIIDSGRFVVVLSHADHALRETTLMQYIDEISGHPLHEFLIRDAEGRILAVNNVAGTKYQKDKQRQILLNLVRYTCNQPIREVSYGLGVINQVPALIERLSDLATMVRPRDEEWAVSYHAERDIMGNVIKEVVRLVRGITEYKKIPSPKETDPSPNNDK